jgi:hypothetical protein
MSIRIGTHACTEHSGLRISGMALTNQSKRDILVFLVSQKIKLKIQASNKPESLIALGCWFHQTLF